MGVCEPRSAEDLLQALDELAAADVRFGAVREGRGAGDLRDMRSEGGLCVCGQEILWPLDAMITIGRSKSLDAQAVVSWALCADL